MILRDRIRYNWPTTELPKTGKLFRGNNLSILLKFLAKNVKLSNIRFCCYSNNSFVQGLVLDDKWLRTPPYLVSISAHFPSVVFDIMWLRVSCFSTHSLIPLVLLLMYNIHPHACMMTKCQSVWTDWGCYGCKFYILHAREWKVSAEI